MRSVVAAVCVLFLATGLMAEDLVLKDGRYLQVKILSHTESGIQVRNLENGGEIFISWDLLREADRDRLMIQFGLKEAELEVETIPGVHIVTRDGDEYLGVPVGELTVQNLPEEVKLHWHGSETTIPRSKIRSIEFKDIPPTEAYKVDQLYAMKIQEVQPAADDLEAHWDLSRYCQSIEDYEHAYEHLLKVKEIDSLYRTDYVGNQLERLDVLVRNKLTMEAIRDARMRSRFHHYSDALERMDQILSVEDLDPQIRAVAEVEKADMERRRWAYYKKQVRTDYFRYMDRLIGKVASDSKIKIQEAQRYVRSKLHKEIVQALADRHSLDPKGEVQKMWDEREVYAPRMAWYGSGSFVVLGRSKNADRIRQQMQRQMARQLQEQRSRSGRSGRNRPVTQLKMPKPLTKDEWWGQASSGVRSMWMKAYFAEHGRSLKVVSADRTKPCQQCGASGAQTTQGPQGESLTIVCTRCQGHGQDKGVAYK